LRWRREVLRNGRIPENWAGSTIGGKRDNLFLGRGGGTKEQKGGRKSMAGKLGQMAVWRELDVLERISDGSMGKPRGPGGEVFKKGYGRGQTQSLIQGVEGVTFKGGGGGGKDVQLFQRKKSRVKDRRRNSGNSGPR